MTVVRVGGKRERKFKSVCAPQCAPLLTLSFLPKTVIVPVFENREQLPKERLPFFMGLVVKTYESGRSPLPARLAPPAPQITN